MDAIQLTHFSQDYSGLKLVQLPVPELQKGELLVRVLCSPVNPADLMTLEGTYIIDQDPPFFPGMVGVGEVVDSKAGLMGAFFKSKRVVFGPAAGRGGAWAQYAVTLPTMAIPISKKLTDENAVNLVANATTTLGLFDTLKRGGHKAAIITAAAGDLGRMLNSAADPYKIKLLNVVRSPEQVAILKALGAKHILNMSEPDFPERLKADAHQLGAQAAIDSICGEMTECLMNAMPPKSTIWILGRLSGQNISLDGLRQFAGNGHTLKGFSLYDWFLAKPLPARLYYASLSQKLLIKHYKTKVQHKLSLEDAATRLNEFVQSTTDGKTLIIPGHAGA